MALSLEVQVSIQKMFIYQDGQLIDTYSISTGKNGVGEMRNSEQTPRGLHIIRAKIGAYCAPNTVFVGRRSTGEIYTPELRVKYPERDWILTRIFWLSGLEKNKNRLGNVDTMQRYIYIHGTDDENTIGTPLSHGCIRMRNQDVIDLFKKVTVGESVFVEI